eukprot:TRINITY_DN1768_c0_g1_i2.p1 TRINITY_DN1768_c0_g1~~TRINITY_DN1768_c0_g1_i2.p1  ORF type:complete len:118 (-),score=33.90 TRINITY_DN1768_c0_g1_i2:78-431(-)
MGNRLASVLKDPKNEKKARKVFKHYDTDKSGTLSKEEWVYFGRDLFEIDKVETEKEMKKNMGLLGTMAGGMLVNMIDVNKFIDDLFKDTDVNNDGQISFDEFKKFLEDHHNNNSLVK